MGITGDGGLLEAEDWLLPELLLKLYSLAPSLFESSFTTGEEGFGEAFPVGVPNWNDD